jgi:hypothetical protein
MRGLSMRRSDFTTELLAGYADSHEIHFPSSDLPSTGARMAIALTRDARLWVSIGYCGLYDAVFVPL